MTEREVRRVLISRLASTEGYAGATFICEMFLDNFSRRADLVVVGDKLSVFEIKSDRDTLDRLEGQVNSYVRFFEQVTIVCAKKHLSGVLNVVPETVSIWSINENGNIAIVRRSKTQFLRSQVNWLSFLPVDELKSLLRQEGGGSIGNRSDLLNLAKHIPLDIAREYVLNYLKRRDIRIQSLIKKRAEKRSQIIPNTVTDETRLSSFLKNQSEFTTAIPRLKSYCSKSSCPSS
ncbi:MAG: sce7726 family protein [Leptospirillum sp.]